MNLFKNRSFTFLWIGNAASELGGAFGTFCNSLLIYELTGSIMALGSMWLLYFLPSLVLQLFIGPYIDIWSRKWIMVFSLWSRAVIFLIPLIGFMTDSLVPWHIYSVQVIIGLITPLYVPANQAILPTLIPKEQLAQANATVDGINRLMTFIAPAAAGFVIEYVNIGFTLILICMMLSLSGFLLAGIHEERDVRYVRESWVNQFKVGIRFFFMQRTIVWLGIFLAFVQFGVGVTKVITLPYITSVLDANYAMYGYFMAGFPLGYIIGTLFAGKIRFHSRRLLMLGSLAIGGITYINLGITDSIVFAIATELIAGIVMAFFNTHNLTIFQQTVPNHLMGKVFSVRSLIIRGVMPLGVFMGGVMSELWSIRASYLFIGFTIFFVSLLGLLLPYFRFIDQPAEEKSAVS